MSLEARERGGGGTMHFILFRVYHTQGCQIFTFVFLFRADICIAAAKGKCFQWCKVIELLLLCFCHLFYLGGGGGCIDPSMVDAPLYQIV